MRFIGTTFQTLDAKGRVVLPAHFKRLLTPADERTMVLTVGREACLLLYPLSEWARLAEALDALPRSEAKRDAIRAISDHTREIELDANGRLTVPRDFLARITAEREVALVGQLRYIELWPREPYEKRAAARLEASARILDEIL